MPYELVGEPKLGVDDVVVAHQDEVIQAAAVPRPSSLIILMSRMKPKVRAGAISSWYDSKLV